MRERLAGVRLAACGAPSSMFGARIILSGVAFRALFNGAIVVQLAAMRRRVPVWSSASGAAAEAAHQPGQQRGRSQQSDGERDIAYRAGAVRGRLASGVAEVGAG